MHAEIGGVRAMFVMARLGNRENTDSPGKSARLAPPALLRNEGEDI